MGRAPGGKRVRTRHRGRNAHLHLSLRGRREHSAERFQTMSRTGNPERKGQLLDQIMEYLVDVPLSHASFRALADALGVSTFALVYHFGNREQLDNEIVGVVRAGQLSVIEDVDIDTLDPDAFEAFAHRVWEGMTSRRGILISRLSFEAGVTEPLREAQEGMLRVVNDAWVDFGTRWLVGRGLDEKQARVETEIFIAAHAGVRYRLHLNGNVEEATEIIGEIIHRYADVARGI